MAYNYQIVIQQTTESRGTAGGVEDTWSTYKTVYAEVDDASSGLGYASEQPVFEFSKTFKFRTADAPAVTSKMRISYDSDFYYIRTIRKEGRLNTIVVAEAFDDE